MLMQHTRSVLLDGYSSVQFRQGRFQHHAASDSTLTQLYRFLCQLSYGPTHCTFVYDGDARAIMKRGIKVVKKEPVLYQKSKALVKAFGFSVQMVNFFFFPEKVSPSTSGIG